MKWCVSLLVWMALAIHAQAQLTVPTEVKGSPGAFITLVAETTGTEVRFVAMDEGLSIFPPDLLANKKATVVVGMKAGRYRVLAYSSVANKPTPPAICLVIVGDPGPNPPGPGPEPTPPGPDPSNPISVALWKAWDRETQADKSAKAALLSAAFDKVAKNFPATAKTVGDVNVYLGSMLGGLLSKTDLPFVKQAIQDVLLTELGRDLTKEINYEPTRLLMAQFAEVLKSLR